MKLITTLLFTTIAIHAEPVFIGTGDKGIYLSDFDAEKGTLTEPTLAVEYNRPGFLALHPEKPILYSTGGNNTVAGFTIGEGNSLTLLGSASSGGNGSCHLAIDPSGQTLAVANYGDGSVVTIRLDAEGKPGKPVSQIEIEGSGPMNAVRKSRTPTASILTTRTASFSRRISAQTRHSSTSSTPPPRKSPRTIPPLLQHLPAPARAT